MPVGDRDRPGFLWVLARTWHGVKVRAPPHQLEFSYWSASVCFSTYGRASGWKTGGQTHAPSDGDTEAVSAAELRGPQRQLFIRVP